MCSCQGVQETHTINTVEEVITVECVNCTGPLVSMQGITIPAHKRKWLITTLKSQIKHWEKDGYEFLYYAS